MKFKEQKSSVELVNGFPSVSKVELKPNEKSKPLKTKVNQASISERLSEFGLVDDKAMGEENINTLMKMSKEQVAQEQADLISIFSSK